MTEISEISPGLVLVLGGLAMSFLEGRAWKAASLAVPLVCLWYIWQLDGSGGAWNFVGHNLDFVHIQPHTHVFATVFALMAFGGALFALNQDRRVEVPAAFCYGGGAIGVTFSGDLLSLFIWWEVMAIGSTVVVWSGGTEAARQAGQRYANVHFVGGVLFMAGLALHVSDGHSLVLTNFSALATPAAIFILIGVLINSGAPPFGSWLPDAYPEASVSGTVFLSAFTTKTTVFVLISLFAGTQLLIYLGALMAVYGIVYAILENDVRRILAYSIVNQVGFMVCAVGIGTPMALNGASAHAFAHIIYKALLLMSAGSVLYATGKRKCTDVGGLYHTMPVTMWCGIIGALAISAMPLTSGFTTKSMITDAAATEHLAFAWFILVAASAGVFLHAGIKFPWFVFFQRDSGLRPPEVPLNMRLAMLIFAGLCIYLGVHPEPLYAILPFPGPSGTVEYQAFTFAHVVSQLQLLMFSGLAFFVLLPMLRRTLTITLDFDWLYRKLVPDLWSKLLMPGLRLLQPLHQAVTEGLPRRVASRILAGSAEANISGSSPESPVARAWTVGSAVWMVTFALAVFLAANLFI